jgi:S1-C subfamily serine protease
VVGKTVELRILRDGEEQRVELTLGQRPSPEERVAVTETQVEEGQAPAPASGGTWLGINGVTLTRDLNRLLDLASRERGVLVVTVAPNSPADDGGLRGGDTSETLNDQEIMVGGDVILALDGEDITSIEQLAETIQAKEAGDEIELTVLRDGEEQTLTVTLAERPASQ